MSPYARQFVEQLEKPDVDLVTGLPPSVAIEQRVTRGGGKSTVATVTEVYHFLRLLFAKLGNAVLPEMRFGGREAKPRRHGETGRSASEGGSSKCWRHWSRRARASYRRRALGGAPGVRNVVVDGKLVPISHFRKLERFREHTIDVVVGVIDRRESRKRATSRSARSTSVAAPRICSTQRIG